MIASSRTTRLTDSDIKALRYECRPGVFIALAIALLGSFFTIMHHVLGGDEFNHETINSIKTVIFIIVFMSIIFGYLLVKRYIQDIRNGEKEIVLRTIKRKESNVDYEAGSGALVGMKMNAYDTYRIVVGDNRYDIDRNMYYKCKQGDEVLFYVGPISRKVLAIELKDS